MACLPIPVVIADDHPVVLQGLASLLKARRELELVGLFPDGLSALKGIFELQPAVAVVDIKMPRLSGLELLRELRKTRLDTRVILLTADVSEEDVGAARRLGSAGIILKDAAPDHLVTAVRHVAGGGELVWPSQQELHAEPRDNRLQISLLTAAELRVARLFAKGLPTKEIARSLDISNGTARVHLHRIYEKLEVRDRAGLGLLIGGADFAKSED